MTCLLTDIWCPLRIRINLSIVFICIKSVNNDVLGGILISLADDIRELF